MLCSNLSWKIYSAARVMICGSLTFAMKINGKAHKFFQFFEKILRITFPGKEISRPTYIYLPV